MSKGLELFRKELRPVLLKHFELQYDNNENPELYDKNVKEYLRREIQLLSQDVNVTIEFIDECSATEFELLTDVWCYVINKTKSKELADKLISYTRAEGNNLSEYEGRLGYSLDHDDF